MDRLETGRAFDARPYWAKMAALLEERGFTVTGRPDRLIANSVDLSNDIEIGPAKIQDEEKYGPDRPEIRIGRYDVVGNCRFQTYRGRRRGHGSILWESITEKLIELYHGILESNARDDIERHRRDITNDNRLLLQAIMLGHGGFEFIQPSENVGHFAANIRFEGLTIQKIKRLFDTLEEFLSSEEMTFDDLKHP